MPEESSEKAQAHIANLSDPLLQKLSQRLIENLGASTWLSWFRDVEITAKSKHRLFLSCPTRFMRNYIQNHFSQAVLSAVQSVSSAIREIDYGVREPITAEPSSLSVSKLAPRVSLREGVMPELLSEAPSSFPNGPDPVRTLNPRRIRPFFSSQRKKTKGREEPEEALILPFSSKRQAHE